MLAGMFKFNVIIFNQQAIDDKKNSANLLLGAVKIYGNETLLANYNWMVLSKRRN